MSNNAKWFTEIESQYRSYFTTRLKKSLPDYSFYFPTEESNSTPTKFPTVFFHETDQMETGSDLYNDGVNAVMETIEVQVVTNESLAENKDITATTAVLMKQLRFSMASAPTYLKEGENIRRSVARYRRTIGCDDVVL